MVANISSTFYPVMSSNVSIHAWTKHKSFSVVQRKSVLSHRRANTKTDLTGKQIFTWRPSQTRLSHYLMPLRRSANDLAEMRQESDNAEGMFNQLNVALRHGLIRRLDSLSHQIEAIKSQLQVRFTLPLFIMQSMRCLRGKWTTKG